MQPLRRNGRFIGNGSLKKTLYKLEKWQSGRMRQSWKLLRVTPPGVRIPLSPQKETHNESCGFFVFTNKRNLFQLERGNKKTSKRQLALGSMLARDYLLGSIAPQIILSKWIPAFAGMTIKYRLRTQKTSHAKWRGWGFYACPGLPFGITNKVNNPDARRRLSRSFYQLSTLLEISVGMLIIYNWVGVDFINNSLNFGNWAIHELSLLNYL